ncbi:MAG TPA: hypothetical protein VGA37_10210 [Gemmatimonadales bacterium]
MKRSGVAAGLILVAVAVSAFAQQAAKPKPVSHDLAGRAQCLMCHGGTMEGIPAAPASHADRPNTVCLWCHAKDAAMQTKDPKVIPHDLAGRDQCLMCHSGAMEGIPAVTPDHEGRDVKFCGMCHKPAG